MVRWDHPDDRVTIKVTRKVAEELRTNARFLGVTSIQMLHLVVRWALRSRQADKHAKLHLTYYARFVRYKKTPGVRIWCARRLSAKLHRWAKDIVGERLDMGWRGALVAGCWEAWKSQQSALTKKGLRG